MRGSEPTEIERRVLCISVQLHGRFDGECLLCSISDIKSDVAIAGYVHVPSEAVLNSTCRIELIKRRIPASKAYHRSMTEPPSNDCIQSVAVTMRSKSAYLAAEAAALATVAPDF